MAKSDNGDVNNRLSPSTNNDPNNSLLKKVTSRVSGLLPTSLSKWFGESGRTKPVIRRRDDQNSADEDDEDTTTIQPPKKRARKAPTLSDTTFPVLSPSGFKFTSIPAVNHNNDHLMRLQPGPSGYTRQITNREIFVDTLNTDTAVHLNGDDRSDSGESTSGYSSVPLPNVQKDSFSDKESKAEVNSSKLLDKSPVTPVRSLFSEQNLTPNRTSLSSRRPSFNASTFGSPSFVDRTLTTKQIMNSPFYSGKIIFGGAAAYQRNRKIFPRDDSHRLAVKNSVQIKPINENEQKTESNHLSKTAKRILDCLEHFNSPVADAKKIPPVIRQNIQKTKSKLPNKELLIPTVPELLKMKLKSRLQDSTVAVRSVATTSKSVLNTEYSLRTEDNTEKQKQSNKIKSKISSVREKRNELHNKAPEQVILPEVQLPITNLPKFDFYLPTPSAVVTSKPDVTISSTQNTTISTQIDKKKEIISNSSEFKFASPISINDVPKSIISVNNFKFSQPLDVKKSSQSNNHQQTEVSKPAVGFRYIPPTNLTPKRKEISKNNGQNKELYSIAPASKLVSGSVMDILGKPSEKKEENIMDKFKPASGTWECSTCMVRNIETATKCIACETLSETTKKEPTFNKPLTGFSSQFKLASSDKWECSVCLVRNKNEDSKCVACTNPKPVKTSTSAPTNNIPVSSGFGDKFKPSSDTWECNVCMIRNKSSATKCVACETPKPGTNTDKPRLIMPPATNSKPGFGDIVKKQQERWECSTCLVRNPPEAKSCTSCGTNRPGVPQFNFGTNPSAPKFKFATTTSDDKTAAGFTLGAKSSSSPATGFKFGVPSTMSAPTGFQFGVPSSTTTAPISFGVPSTTATAPISFGVFSSTTTAPISFGILSTTTTTPVSFGVPKPAEKVNKTPEKAPKLSFNAPEKKSIDTPDIVVIDDDDDEVPVKKTKSEQPKEVPKQDGAFMFGAKKASTNAKDIFAKSRPEATKPIFSFGQPTKTTGTEEKKISFDIPPKENKPETEKAPMFDFNAQKSPAAAVANTAASQMFSFGAPASTSTKTSTATSGETKNTFASTFQVPKFSFGSSALPFTTKSVESTTTTTQSAMFSFGSSSTITAPKPAFELPKQAEVKPFSFGAPASAPKTESFAFKPNESSAPSFNFSGNASSTTANSSSNVFSFESAGQKATSDNQTSTFGSIISEASGNKPMFGSAISGTSLSGTQQSQPLNNGFNFAPAASSGANSTFKFGQSFAVSSSTQSPAVFSFGQAGSGPPAPGIFSFGQSSTPASAFNPDTKPSFNFTSGVQPSFSAQAPVSSSTTAAPVRKIRKAVRRVTQPR